MPMLKGLTCDLAFPNTFNFLSTNQTNTTSPMNRFKQSFMNQFLTSTELIIFQLIIAIQWANWPKSQEMLGRCSNKIKI